MPYALTTTQKGIFAAFLGFSGFALADACAKWLGAYYDPLTVLMWTYIFTLIFSTMLSSKLGGLKETLRTKKLLIHIGRGACALFIGFLVISALSQGLQLSSLYTVLFLSPFLTTIVAIPVYKEHVTLKMWGIIALGFSGIVVAFHDGLSAVSGPASLAFSALAFIVGLGILARPLTHNETLLSLSFYPALTISTVMGIYHFPDYHLPAPEHLPIFMMNGIFAGIGLTGIACGYRIAPYGVVAPVHYSQMVIAVILGYLIFGDVPNFWTMAGAAIIITSGILLVLDKTTQKIR